MSDAVLIIGGGVAGLTAALALSVSGHRVTLVEQEARVAGRLATAPPGLLLACHTATWALLEQLHMADALRRSKPARIDFLQTSGSRVQYPSLPLPSPLNTLIGTTLFQGLSMRDRWHLLSFLERTWERDPPMPQDLELRTAENWLANIDQSEAARTDVWNPLSRLLLGNAIHEVSAALYMRTLRRSFFTGTRPARFIIPDPGFRDQLLDALQERILGFGTTIQLNARVNAIHVRQERVTGIRLDNGETLSADGYICAVPVSSLRRLLPEHVVTHYAYFQQLGKLTESQLLTVRVRVAKRTPGPSLTLLSQRPFHWIVCQPDILSPESTVLWLAATGDSPLFRAAGTEVLTAAKADIARAYPLLEPAPLLDHHVTHVPQAFLFMNPGAQQYRPLPRSPFGNLFLAGDWSDTGWPANLESAVLSGRRAAEAVAPQRAIAPSR